MKKEMHRLYLFILLSLPSLLVCYDETKLFLPLTTIGPEASTFDSADLGPYSSVSDGRVLKYVNQTVGFVDFAVTSPTRPKQLCDGNFNPALETTCGRPLGLGFYNRSGSLYVADAYFGLRVVGARGGIATAVSLSAEGIPYKFLNALDIDQQNGIVYFIDSSSRFLRSEFNLALLSGDKTGRLMKYDVKTNEVTVLLRNLGLPVGIAVSKSGSYVLVTEALYKRAIRLWIQGSKANTTEIFAMFSRQPDNIRRNINGEFWVPLNNVTAPLGSMSVAVRLSEDGNVEEILELGLPTAQYSEFQEVGNRLFYIGSLNLNYVRVIDDRL